MHLSDFMSNYVSEHEFETRTYNQKQFANEYLKILDDLDSDRELPREIEFFFYTDSKVKAKGLKNDLKDMGYDVYGINKSTKKSYSVIGASTPVILKEESFKHWVQTMNEIGFANDCLFDGWGMISEMDL